MISEPSLPPVSPPAATHNLRRWRWRMAKDVMARYGVAAGGVGVIVAILLIFFYLFYVVIPLFKPAETTAVGSYGVPVPAAGPTAYLALEEQTEIGVRFTSGGQAIFFRTSDGVVIKEEGLRLPPDVTVTSSAAGIAPRGVVAYGLSNGRAVLMRHVYQVSFPDNKRTITPAVEYPLGEAPLAIDAAGRALTRLAVQSDEDQATLLALTADGELVLSHVAREESFLSEGEAWKTTTAILPRPPISVDYLLVDPDQRHAYFASSDGELYFFDIGDKSVPRLIQRLRVVPQGKQITALRFLAGGTSLLVGESGGVISQWFPVRDARNDMVLTRIRDFTDQHGAVNAIAAEYARKGFLAADAGGKVAIYHATAHRTLTVAEISAAPLLKLAVAPRGDALLAEASDGQLHFWRVENQHPEISWSALWGKVWYEGYAEPTYTWQSSSASNEFEPKFSLTPISFGTLKAAFYAMILAAPLAILGAIYTAHFMAPRMRRVVKPSVEVMEALPTVILGFLAGLWLAPFVEDSLPGIVTMLLVVPMGIVVTAYVWTLLPERLRLLVPDGWEAALLIPVVLVLGWGSLAMSPVFETAFFGGDIRQWLTNEMGLAFDQRNSLVVGLAMGFAVIPNIFSIAEDAIFGVPKHLTNGSLALGATPWQTMWRVVLLTASPGIFSALMIGFGRAVGETMIVLMATGNTPVMDWSIFQGMRTLSANIAVEMPESEVNSTHYRVLFLAALVLFIFTFFFNTMAEVVRQRLRRKYSSL